MGRMKDTLGGDPFEPAFRLSDPITSRLAVLDVSKVSGRDRLKALEMHAQHPQGLTDFELASLLDKQQTSIGKRRGELRDIGMIEATESHRPAPSGSAAIVWRITEAGLLYIKERPRGSNG